MKRYDVVVCGAGIAGIAASVAAARRGKKVLLIEKQTIVGGLATSGLIYIYLPASGDDGKIVTSGIAEELLRAAPAYGPFELPEKYGGPSDGECGIRKDRFNCCFSPAGYTLTLEKLLRDSGVELLLETSVIGVRCDQNCRICEAELFCGSDRWSVSADCFIDASGGAFMLRMAGEKVYGEVNYFTPWFIEENRSKAGAKSFFISDDLHVVPCGTLTEENSIKAVLSVDELQTFTRRQYEMIRAYADNIEPEKRKTCYPVHIPAMPQIRKIARVDALSLITDGEAGICRSDSIGVAADWRDLAPSWETPYGALVPRNVRGALAAGRCINSAGDAWEIFRVIPAAAMTGEAAGVAAALCCDRGIDPAVLPAGDLQNELLKNNVILHIADGR